MIRFRIINKVRVEVICCNLTLWTLCTVRPLLSTIDVEGEDRSLNLSTKKVLGNVVDPSVELSLYPFD